MTLLNRAFLLMVLAVAGGATMQGSSDGSIDRVDAFVRAEMARQKVPGVAVAIVGRDTQIVAKGYGLANVEHDVPVTAETIFQSGSLGKQFTSAAVMLQVEDGKIALDDPITKYFPDAPETWRSIRIRHLLTHTSGIPDYTNNTIDYRRDYTEDELTKLAYGLKLEFEPGSRWNYSNTGYMLLGFLVRRVSGQFYGDVLQERVFKPLGMKTTRIITEEDIVPHRAAGYRLVKGELKNQEWVAPKLNTTADGSLYFSAVDLVAWDRGLRAKAILKPESWAQIFRPVTLNSGKTYPYGFGWSIDEIGGQPRQSHGGSWQGFETYIARYLGDELTIVVLTNLGEADPGRFVDGIAAIFNPKLAEPERTPMTDSEPATALRVRALLAAAARGTLSPADFAYVRAGFFPEAAEEYKKLLGPLGSPERLDLLERVDLGDDRISSYVAVYPQKSLLVDLGLAPDGRISTFYVRRKEP